MKRFISFLLSAIMVSTLCIPAMAADIDTQSSEDQGFSSQEIYRQAQMFAQAKGIDLLPEEIAFAPSLEDRQNQEPPSILATIPVPSSAITVTEGKGSSQTLTANGEKWFTFKTPSGGAYNIYTTGSTNTFGELYKKGIAGLSIVTKTGTGGSGNNFQIKTDLKNNTTYYVKVKGAKSSANGNFRFHFVGNQDSKASASGGNWKWSKMDVDPDGAFFNIDQITYLDKEKAQAYYIMVSCDQVKAMRDKLLNMSYSAAVTYLTANLPDKIAKKITSGATGWIISQLPGFNAPNLTKLELDSIAKAAGIGSDGVATRGLKIISCTSYSSSGMPVMMNTYESWSTKTMRGQKYYRGEFGTSTTPMWR